MSHPLVVNVRDLGSQPWPEDVVYVGRFSSYRRLAQSIWANPFKMSFIAGDTPGERTRIIALYRNRLLARPDLLARLTELRGKRLACWCSPLDCHADVLAVLANAPEAAS